MSKIRFRGYASYLLQGERYFDLASGKFDPLTPNKNFWNSAISTYLYIWSCLKSFNCLMIVFSVFSDDFHSSRHERDFMFPVPPIVSVTNSNLPNSFNLRFDLRYTVDAGLLFLLSMFSLTLKLSQSTANMPFSQRVQKFDQRAGRFIWFLRNSSQISMVSRKKRFSCGR